MDLVYLEWLDSAGADGWHRVDDPPAGLILVRTVGWVMHESDQHITVAGTIGREDDRPGPDPTQAHGWMSIPKAAITRRVVIPLRALAGEAERAQKSGEIAS